MKTFGIIFGVVFIFAISIAAYVINVSNSEIKLRETIAGQQEMTQAFYTNVWEILTSKAGVAKEYSTEFLKIQTAIMEGRYSSGGEMMKWITEANPNFEASLYMDIMNSIEGERKGFFVEQTKLRDMSVRHGIMLKTFPKKLILGNREPIEVVILQNLASIDAYSTGVEKTVPLFQN